MQDYAAYAGRYVSGTNILIFGVILRVRYVARVSIRHASSQCLSFRRAENEFLQGPSYAEQPSFVGPVVHRRKPQLALPRNGCYGVGPEGTRGL
jgi:hypothetical protein